MRGKSESKKIGILGGTFNPPHLGHLILGEEARTCFDLDKVVFIPVFSPPHKKARNLAPAHLRLKMLKQALKGYKFFDVDDCELRRKGLSFTVDTLYYYKKHHPSWRIHLIVGSDAVRNFFRDWRSPCEILKMATLCVAHREGYELQNSLKIRKVRTFKVTRIDISSSFIRQMVKRGFPVGVYLPPGVENIIKRHNLYR